MAKEQNMAEVIEQMTRRPLQMLRLLNLLLQDSHGSRQQKLLRKQQGHHLDMAIHLQVHRLDMAIRIQVHHPDTAIHMQLMGNPQHGHHHHRLDTMERHHRMVILATRHTPDMGRLHMATLRIQAMGRLHMATDHPQGMPLIHIQGTRHLTQDHLILTVAVIHNMARQLT